MANIKITCDSACDLPQALAQRYQITVLPLEVDLGQQRRRDQLDVSAQELYRYSDSTGKLPGICPVSREQYLKCFQSLLSQGYQVLHISLSSGISRCYENAASAARGLKDVKVVDSQSISVGIGQLALLASELKSADYRLEELSEALNEMKHHMEVSCVLQSSELLHRSGSRGGIHAFGEKLLKLKPELSLKDGLIRYGRPFRGDLEDSILCYVRRSLEGRKNIQTDRILLTYSGVPQSIIREVKNLLQQLQHFDQVLELPAASAVSCRCGPGSLGLAFMTN